MKKTALLVGLILLFAFSPVPALADTVQRQAGIPSDELQDPATERACSCCQKCNAARRDTVGGKEDGAVHTNGCEECCERCGKKVPPAPDELPPDMIDKKHPPEVIEKDAPSNVIDREPPYRVKDQPGR